MINPYRTWKHLGIYERRASFKCVKIRSRKLNQLHIFYSELFFWNVQHLLFIALFWLFFLLHVFQRHQASEAHDGSGECVISMPLYRLAFYGSLMHTWCRCLSPIVSLSTLYSTQGTSSMCTNVLIFFFRPSEVRTQDTPLARLQIESTNH